MRDIFTTSLRYKIRFDLLGAWQRTLQAILTIAIGAFAVGTILGAYQGVIADSEHSWDDVAAPAIRLRIVEGADGDLLDRVAHRSELSAVEGQMEYAIKWRPTPDAPWQAATLVAREDYTDQKLSILSLDEGNWPVRRTMAVERSYPIAIGGQVELNVDDHVVTAPIDGVVYNPVTLPASLGGTPTFYTTRRHFGDLTGQDRFQFIYATVPDYTPARAAAAAASLQADLKDQGLTAIPATTARTYTIDPAHSWSHDLIGGIGFVMQTIALVAMLLSLLLIYNTVTAIIAQQTSQIGELKAIGASSRQILALYITIVAIYGLCALVISLPLSILAANGLRTVLIARLGVTPGPFRLDYGPLLLQSAICLVLPILVAFPPILGGARITVREAINSYGLSGGGSALDEFVGQLRWLSRVFSLAISNAFGNWRRLLLTQLALAGAGIALVAVMSTQATLSYASSGLFNELYRFPIQLDLSQPARWTQLERAASFPGVENVEIWRTLSGVVEPLAEPMGVSARRSDQGIAPIRLDGQDGTQAPRAIELNGVPIPSVAYEPQLAAGRWFTPDDTYAIVLAEGVAKEMGVGPGDWVHVQLPAADGRKSWASERDWQVVGVIVDPNIRNLSRMGMVPRATLLAELQDGRVGNRVLIQASLADPAAAPAFAADLRAFYDDLGIRASITQNDTVYQRSTRQSDNLRVISTLLMAMAVIVGAVGGIALSGVLSISVLERRREIGVLRAIGATPRTIRTLFMSEGLLLGWLSWLLTLAFSYPVGVALAQQVAATIGISIIFHYSWAAVAAWLGLASLIGILASIGPAQGAIKASVQESLAYE